MIVTFHLMAPDRLASIMAKVSLIQNKTAARLAAEYILIFLEPFAVGGVTSVYAR